MNHDSPTTGEYLAMSTFTDTPGVPEIALGMLFPHLRITKVVRINPWVIAVQGTDWDRGDMMTSFFLSVSGQSFPVDGARRRAARSGSSLKELGRGARSGGRSRWTPSVSRSGKSGNPLALLKE